MEKLSNPAEVSAGTVLIAIPKQHLGQTTQPGEVAGSNCGRLHEGLYCRNKAKYAAEFS